MAITIFSSLSDKDKTQAIEHLISESTPRQGFFFLIGLSVLMAAFGMLLNSDAIIIGSMLIAPLLYPLLSLGMGFVMADFKLILRALYTIIKSTVIGILLAVFVTLLFSRGEPLQLPEIIGWTSFLVGYVFVAIISGLAGSFAFAHPQHNEHLPGVAISVALIPPVAIIGIGLAWLDWNLVRQALLLYSVNVVGVLIASILIFSRMGLHVHKKIAQKAVKKEERAVEKEVEAAESKKM